MKMLNKKIKASLAAVSLLTVFSSVTKIAMAAEAAASSITATASSNATEPVVENDLTDLQQQVASLTEKVDNIISMPIDIFLGIVAGIVVLGLILALYAVSKTSKQQKLNKKLQQQESNIREQTEELAQLKQQVNKIREEYEQLKQLVHMEPPVERLTPVMPKAVPVYEPAQAWKIKANQFTEDYNRYLQMNLDGYEMRSQKNNFLIEHNIEGFFCDNSTQRMSNPNMEPHFVKTATPKEGAYWACPLGNDLYAVVPKGREYESQMHSTAGYKEVFSSNYTDGACKVIKVIKPAIFRGLTLKECGELQLGR